MLCSSKTTLLGAQEQCANLVGQNIQMRLRGEYFNAYILSRAASVISVRREGYRGGVENSSSVRYIIDPKGVDGTDGLPYLGMNLESILIPSWVSFLFLHPHHHVFLS